MLTSLARYCARRRRPVLVLAALAAVACALLGHGVASRLASGGWTAPGSPSARAEALLTDRFHAGAPDVVLLARAQDSVDAPAARAAGLALAGRLCREPGVTGVDSYWTGPVARGSCPTTPTTGGGRAPGGGADVDDAALRSDDARTALVAVRLDGDGRTGRAAVERLLPAVTAPHGPLQVQATGHAVLDRALERYSERDLLRTELIALPATLLLLVFVFGSVAAACLPLAVGAVAVAGTLAVLRGLTAVTEVSTFALNLTGAVGLALSVDYSLYLVARYREEIASGSPPEAALEGAVRSAGRIVVVSAAAVALCLLGLLAFPLYFLRSLAYAGVSVVLLAALAALVLVPAALACFPRAIGRGDLFARWRRAPGRAGGGWRRLALRVMRRPLLVTALATGVLLVLALPFRQVVFGFSDDRVLPRDAPEVRATQALRDGFPQLRNPVEVALPGWRPDRPGRIAELDAYARRLSALPGVQGVRTATGSYVLGQDVPLACPAEASPAHGTLPGCPALRHFTSPAGTWLAVSGAAEPYAPASTALVARLQAARAPTPAAPLVGGPTAQFRDARDTLAQRLPWALGAMAVATFVLLLAFTRSVFLPLKALAVNLLSLTATFGAMVFVFQQGHLKWLVGDFTATGTVSVVMPVVAFCLAFGLSLDYEILLLARIGEAHARTGDTVRATAAGLQAAGPLFTASAALVLTVLLALATAEVALMKLLAVTTALSVVLDAAVIRPLLVPAVMRLAGRANWWMPALPRRAARTVLPQPSPSPETAGASRLGTSGASSTSRNKERS
ncbi:MMPL family transporter [Streptomyces hiroshimensis]|uniref:Membrane protein n=1 Tax=Streptomyces hiroshimensis TaxID=66424 RepID=A0ABQ2YM98_9ACTN|nr:MMPL family transporter [Streptomyces hiroshimensis]GGX88382.1 membrane protein [Streptomyces hiroshimensis]